MKDRVLSYQLWSKQFDFMLAILFLIVAAIVTTITRSGGEPGKQSYIESQRQEISQIADNQFCLNFAKSLSGTVEYKITIYQNCTGD